jgi:hypothetical protein
VQNRNLPRSKARRSVNIALRNHIAGKRAINIDVGDVIETRKAELCEGVSSKRDGFAALSTGFRTRERISGKYS